jgi:holo-[acyl-carrier protein] synthase
MTVRHGVDLVEVDRIAALRAAHADRFLSRCFTAKERDYALRASKRADEHFAARFAAKEAVLKALGSGLRGGLAWTDIEVTRDGLGAPGLALHNRAAERAAALGVVSWSISLSHTSRFAVASVIGLVPAALG